MRLIDAKVLYNELAKIEDSTRKEIFKHERSGAEYWMRMGALNQITKLKHFVFDSATVEAKPVVHGEWIEFDADIPTNVVMVKDTLEELMEDITVNTDMVFMQRGADDTESLVGVWM